MDMKKTAADVRILAKAEKILNRTLAYQAAIAVHELKDALGLDVEELRLVVAPISMEAPGAYRGNLHHRELSDTRFSFSRSCDRAGKGGHLQR